MGVDTVQTTGDDWQVLIRDAHPGYIAWAEFERNQLTLQHIAVGFSMTLRGAAPREGVALLQERVLCGRCGSRMRVRNDRRAGQSRPRPSIGSRVISTSRTVSMRWPRARR